MTRILTKPKFSIKYLGYDEDEITFVGGINFEGRRWDVYVTEPIGRQKHVYAVFGELPWEYDYNTLEFLKSQEAITPFRKVVSKFIERGML